MYLIQRATKSMYVPTYVLNGHFRQILVILWFSKERSENVVY